VVSTLFGFAETASVHAGLHRADDVSVTRGEGAEPERTVFRSQLAFVNSHVTALRRARPGG